LGEVPGHRKALLFCRNSDSKYTLLSLRVLGFGVVYGHAPGQLFEVVVPSEVCRDELVEALILDHRDGDDHVAADDGPVDLLKPTRHIKPLQLRIAQDRSEIANANGMARVGVPPEPDDFLLDRQVRDGRGGRLD